MPNEKIAERYDLNRVPSPGNPRQNEAWALIEAARQIAAVIQFGDLTKKEDVEKFRTALRLNLRVWTIIQAEQMVGENQLPAPIRQNILTLCKFIDRHTMEAIMNPNAERAVALIDINRNIASGLLGNPDDEQLTAPDPAMDAALGGGSGGGSGGDDKPHQPLKVEA